METQDDLVRVFIVPMDGDYPILLSFYSSSISGDGTSVASVPDTILKGKSMQLAPTLTLYTYTYNDATTANPEEERWKDRGFPDHFFEDAQAAKRALLEVRDQIEIDDEVPFAAMSLEKIETVPMTKSAILALLNDGVGAIVNRYEIIERIALAKSRGRR